MTHLVAGRHRVEACRRLDIWKAAGIAITDEAEARLWRLSDNLHRTELTAQEQVEHLSGWIAACAEIASRAVEPPKRSRKRRMAVT